MVATNKDPVLAVVSLSGGNDGLNTVIPYNNPRYRDSRPSLGIPEDQIVPITSELGLHPSFAPLKKYWDEGKLAIIQGIGYPNGSLSHFRSMDIWATCEPETLETEGRAQALISRAKGDDRNMYAAGDRPESRDQGRGHVAPPPEEIDRRCPGNQSDQDRVTHRPADHIPAVELKDRLGAGDDKKRDPGNDQAKGHEPTRAEPVGQSADQGGEHAGQPGSQRRGEGQAALIPPAFVGEIDLHAAQHHLSEPTGGEGSHERDGEHQPSVIERRPQTPVDQ